MSDLSYIMQERLEKWRKNTLPVPKRELITGIPEKRRNGKRDFGDVNSLDEMEEEHRKSQFRK